MKFDFTINEIERDVCMEFTQEHHYSPVFPKLTKHFLGVYLKDVLVGTITLGWGTQPLGTIKKLIPEYTTIDYLEIGKMCMTDEMPRNSETQMLKELKNWIKTNRPDVSVLYTMADGIMGKVGYVYQAFNFLYGGRYKTDVYMTKEGEKVHPRSMKKFLIENAKFLNKDKVFWCTHDYMETVGLRRIRGFMYRYMMPLNKNAQKLLKKYNWNINYPKEDSLEWFEQKGFRTYVKIEKPIFNYDNPIINAKNINQHKK